MNWNEEASANHLFLNCEDDCDYDCDYTAERKKVKREKIMKNI